MDESIKAALATFIETWIDEKSMRTIASLSRNSGVSESVIRRAHRKETIPNVDNLLKLLMTVTYSKTFSELRKALPSELDSYLQSKDYIYANTEIQTTRTTLEVETFLQTYENYLIYDRVSHSQSLTRVQIKESFGTMGEKALTELIDAGVITEESNGQLSLGVKNVSISHSLLKRHLPKVVETYYDHEDSRHILANFSETITPDAAIEILELQKQTNSKIAQIMMNNPGSVPYLYVGLFNPMDFRAGEEK